MPAINQLNSVSTPNASDLLPIYSQNNGDARNLSLSNLAAWLSSQPTSQNDNKVTQYSAPNMTDFITKVLDGPDSVWLIMTPANTYLTGTILLPSVQEAIDRQEVLVNYVNGVTGLTVDGNGAVVIGAPIVMTANQFFRLRFDAVTDTWYRVG